MGNSTQNIDLPVLIYNLGVSPRFQECLSWLCVYIASGVYRLESGVLCG